VIQYSTSSSNIGTSPSMDQMVAIYALSCQF
jgi:hypothetical protein